MCGKPQKPRVPGGVLMLIDFQKNLSYSQVQSHNIRERTQTGEVGFVSCTISPKPDKSTTFCFKIIFLPLVQNSACVMMDLSAFLYFHIYNPNVLRAYE